MTSDASILVEEFLDRLGSGSGISPELYTADVRFDATVPHWRFERAGPAAVAAELSGWYQYPTTIERTARRPTPDGEAVEVELSWVQDGEPQAAHQLHVILVQAGRIGSHTVFCGGRWPASLLAEMEAARVQ